jgi:3-oxoacyl-[acyl-carrier protein] reductase
MTDDSPAPMASGLLAGQRVLVTGASRGIGLAIAERFAAAGATLYLNGRDPERLAEVCARLGATALPFDAGDATAVKDAFQQLFRQTRALDVLVNNAGVLEDALLGMVTEGQVTQTFASNTHSVIYCSQYAARMMQRARRGSIINLASIIGREGAAGLSVYAGSKAAVIGITRSLAKELAGSGVRVNAIAPGIIDTDLTRGQPPSKVAERLAGVPMGRVGTADEVAKVALFLASDLASYVTGQIIGVDGGMIA